MQNSVKQLFDLRDKEKSLKNSSIKMLSTLSIVYIYVFHLTDCIHCSLLDMSFSRWKPGIHFYEVAFTIVYMTD